MSIGFLPRERFTLAAESLRRILASTSPKVELLVVDCGLPQSCSTVLRQLCAGRTNVRFLTTANPLQPNQSRNLVLQEAKGDWICLIENDILVEPKWLDTLIETGERLAADVVAPLLVEVHQGNRIVHMDTAADRIETNREGQITIHPRVRPLECDIGAEAHLVEFVEVHCLLFRKEVFNHIGPFDETLNTREWIDLCLALHNTGSRIVLEPAVEVIFEHPSRLEPDERAFNAEAWDFERAAQSHRTIAERWRVMNLPNCMESIVFGRRQLEQAAMINAEVRALIPEDATVVLADYSEWADTEMTVGLKVVPLVQQNGQAWGLPLDDHDALKHLRARINEGCDYLMLTSTWWEEAYPKLFQHLNKSHRLVFQCDWANLYDVKPLIDNKEQATYDDLTTGAIQ